MERKSGIETNVMREAKGMFYRLIVGNVWNGRGIFQSVIQGAKKSALAIGASLLFLAGSADAINSKYKIQRLSWPDPNMTEVEAHSINNSGEVLGVYGVPRSRYTEYKGVFIYREGVMINVELEDGVFMEDIYPAGSFGSPYKLRINDVGDLLLGKYIYKRSNEKITLDLRGRDFNNHCDVIATDPNSRKSYFYPGGNTQEKVEIDSMAAPDYFSINDNREVIGFNNEGSWHWVGGNTTRYRDIVFMDINNEGTISGWYPEGKMYKVTMWKNGLSERISFDFEGWPTSINNDDQMVGRGGWPDHSQSIIQDGEKVAIRDLFPEDSRWGDMLGFDKLFDLNDGGQIVGSGYYTDEKGVSKIQGFLMTPVKLEGDSNKDNRIDARDYAVFSSRWLEDWNYQEPPCARCR